MATATQATQEVQERVLDSVRTGQKAVVDFVRSWAETVETVFTRLPEMTFSTDSPVQPSQTFESTFRFTERLLESQREFASKLLEAAIPAARAGSNAASQTVGQAAAATKAGAR